MKNLGYWSYYRFHIYVLEFLLIVSAVTIARNMPKRFKKVTILATVITAALVLIAPSTILTTGAFAVPRSDKNCLEIQFNTLESDKTITIGTSHDEYSVEIDYYVDTGGFAQNPYYKNVAADEPTGDVLLPGGERITITLRTVETITSFGTHVTLYDNKVSDCKVLLGLAKEKDKIDFEFVDVQQIDEFTVQLTVRVPDATDIDKDFTKLGVQFPSTPESNDYYLMSNRVVVN